MSRPDLNNRAQHRKMLGTCLISASAPALTAGLVFPAPAALIGLLMTPLLLATGAVIISSANGEQ